MTTTPNSSHRQERSATERRAADNVVTSGSAVVLPLADKTPALAPEQDVVDPHPDEEEHYGSIPHPGGANPPKGPDIGPNSYAHDGTPPPRPHNAGSGPQ